MSLGAATRAVPAMLGRLCARCRAARLPAVGVRHRGLPIVQPQPHRAAFSTSLRVRNAAQQTTASHAAADSAPSSRTANDASAGASSSTTSATGAPASAASTSIGKIEQPKYAITFTCKACEHRSSHRMTKHAYHKGTVLIQCPGCRSRHLIADNLKIFSDKDVNVEDLLKARGEHVTRGTTADVEGQVEGDVELVQDDAGQVRLAIAGGDRHDAAH